MEKPDYRSCATMPKSASSYSFDDEHKMCIVKISGDIFTNNDFIIKNLEHQNIIINVTISSVAFPMRTRTTTLHINMIDTCGPVGAWYSNIVKKCPSSFIKKLNSQSGYLTSSKVKTDVIKYVLGFEIDYKSYTNYLKYKIFNEMYLTLYDSVSGTRFKGIRFEQNKLIDGINKLSKVDIYGLNSKNFNISAKLALVGNYGLEGTFSTDFINVNVAMIYVTLWDGCLHQECLNAFQQWNNSRLKLPSNDLKCSHDKYFMTDYFAQCYSECLNYLIPNETTT